MTKLNPLVSVVVTTYNHEKYISECLESILSQKCSFSYEIIIGEDQSSDSTGEICKSYAEKYPDVINLYQRSQSDVIFIKGKATGRYNFMENLRSASGKYIALCDGDDYWSDPLKLQKQIDYLQSNNDCNVCFCRTNLLTNNELRIHSIPEKFEQSSFQYIELLRHYNFIATASVVFRRPEKMEFPELFKKLPFGDLGLYKLISHDKNFYCLPDVMAVYRIHDKGHWSKLNKLNEQRQYLEFYKAIFSKLNKEERKIVKQKIKKGRFNFLKLYIRSIFNKLN